MSQEPVHRPSPLDLFKKTVKFIPGSWRLKFPIASKNEETLEGLLKRAQEVARRMTPTQRARATKVAERVAEHGDEAPHRA